MKKYAIGIDLGGTSVKYALIDNEGVFHFQGKLPSKADVSAEAVIGQLVTACKEAMASALQLGVAVEGIGIGTPGIVDETNRIVLGGAENIKGWENLNLADRIEAEAIDPGVHPVAQVVVVIGQHLGILQVEVGHLLPEDAVVVILGRFDLVPAGALIPVDPTRILILPDVPVPLAVQLVL
mgnify:CR=1 FL=1